MVLRLFSGGCLWSLLLTVRPFQGLFQCHQCHNAAKKVIGPEPRHDDEEK